MRCAQLAAPLSTEESSDTDSYGNTEFIDSDDLRIPLARVRERMAPEELYDSSDDLPLAMVRDGLHKVENPLPRPADLGQDTVTGPLPPGSMDDIDMTGTESEDSATMGMIASEYGKRPRLSNGPAIQS